MFGRVSEIQGSPERVDDAIRQLKDEVVPTLKGVAGAKGFLAFADRSTGALLGISLWADEASMVEARETGSRLRSSAAQATEGDVTDVREYEVVLHDWF